MSNQRKCLLQAICIKVVFLCLYGNAHSVFSNIRTGFGNVPGKFKYAGQSFGTNRRLFQNYLKDQKINPNGRRPLKKFVFSSGRSPQQNIFVSDERVFEKIDSKSVSVDPKRSLNYLAASTRDPIYRHRLKPIQNRRQQSKQKGYTQHQMKKKDFSDRKIFGGTKKLSCISLNNEKSSTKSKTYSYLKNLRLARKCRMKTLRHWRNVNKNRKNRNKATRRRQKHLKFRPNVTTLPTAKAAPQTPLSYNRFKLMNNNGRRHDEKARYIKRSKQKTFKNHIYKAKESLGKHQTANSFILGLAKKRPYSTSRTKQPSINVNSLKKPSFWYPKKQKNHNNKIKKQKTEETKKISRGFSNYSYENKPTTQSAITTGQRAQDQGQRDNCNRYDVDGCSIPFGAPFFYKTLFTKSCYRHDICYHCGVEYGIYRRTCDYALKHNTWKACLAKYGNGTDVMGDPPKRLVIAAVENLHAEFRVILQQEMKDAIAHGKQYEKMDLKNYLDYAKLVLRKVLLLWVDRLRKHIIIKATEHNSVSSLSTISSFIASSTSPYNFFASTVSSSSSSIFSLHPSLSSSPSKSSITYPSYFYSPQHPPSSSQSASISSLYLSLSTPSSSANSLPDSSFVSSSFFFSPNTKPTLNLTTKLTSKPNSRDHFAHNTNLPTSLCSDILNGTKNTGPILHPNFDWSCEEIDLLICHFFSDVYFLAVRIFASSSFHKTPEFYCDQSFVPQCLPPIPT